MNDIITDFKSTGINTVDASKVIKKWNHLWCVTQWHDEYTLTKFKRKDSEIRTLKTRISKEQAQFFKDELKLICVPCAVFWNAKSWKRPQDCK